MRPIGETGGRWGKRKTRKEGDGEYLRKVRWNRLDVRNSAMAEMPNVGGRE